MEFRKAERRKAKLRLGITGPAGSGKTYGALLIAQGLGGKTVLIDTENGSGDLYAVSFDYDIGQIQAPYSVQKYLSAVHDAEGAGYEIIIIDSLSHAWAGEGGLLDMQGKIADSIDILPTPKGVGSMSIDDDSITLKYDYKNYNFVILQENRGPSGLNELSDGYSSILRILSDLILRMDQNWLLKNQISNYNKEGIVLIDEIEIHLHIELQRKILPFLTKFFPRLQFIVSTHSPYVLTSISNAVVFDLERQVALTDLSEYSTEDVANGFFEADSYSVEMEKILSRYKELIKKQDISDAERAERADLRTKLKNAPGELARTFRIEFEEIEKGRKK